MKDLEYFNFLKLLKTDTFLGRYPSVFFHFGGEISDLGRFYPHFFKPKLAMTDYAWQIASSCLLAMTDYAWQIASRAALVRNDSC